MCICTLAHRINSERSTCDSGALHWFAMGCALWAGGLCGKWEKHSCMACIIISFYLYWFFRKYNRMAVTAHNTISIAANRGAFDVFSMNMLSLIYVSVQCKYEKKKKKCVSQIQNPFKLSDVICLLHGYQMEKRK